MQPCGEDEEKDYDFFIFPTNGAPVGWKWRENWSTRGKTCPSPTLSTTNPTWTDPGSKSGLRSGRPATTRLSMARPRNNLGYNWRIWVIYELNLYQFNV
jgi:hypothetical protein